MKILRPIYIIVINVILGNKLFYYLVRVINKYLLGSKVKGIFLVYPANKKYADSFAFSWYQKTMKWRPRLVGLYTQGKNIGIMFGIAATEKEVWDENNLDNLRQLERRFEKIRKIMKVEQKKFAGILPSVMVKHNILSKSNEGEATANAVYKAVELLKEQEKMPKETAVIILGGKGFIGRLIVDKFKKQNFFGRIFSIDLENKNDIKNIKKEIESGYAILLNVTKKGALSEYIPYIWPKVIVLNEVYPEPSEKEIKEIKGKESKCYHIVGVEGKTYPEFPRAYAGGVPCCAYLASENNDNNFNVIIKKC